MPIDAEWLTVKDAAKLVNYHPERVRELIREGRVDAYKFGSVWAVSRKSLLAYVSRAHKVGEKRGPKPG